MKIKFIPMNKDEETFNGMSIEQAQKYYFEGILINENELKNHYYYVGHSIKAEPNDLLLFQYDNNIIASSRLKDVQKYKKNYMKDCDGHIELEKNTIKTFKPIDKIEMKKYIPSFNRFSQSPLEYDEKLVNVEALLNRFDIKNK